MNDIDRFLEWRRQISVDLNVPMPMLIDAEAGTFAEVCKCGDVVAVIRVVEHGEAHVIIGTIVTRGWGMVVGGPIEHVCTSPGDPPPSARGFVPAIVVVAAIVEQAVREEVVNHGASMAMRGLRGDRHPATRWQRPPQV
jgi:hypothetical protein